MKPTKGTLETAMRANPAARCAGLGRILGVSGGSIRNMLRNYDLVLPPIPKDVLIRILARHPGISQVEMATILETSRSAIGKRLRIYGLTTDPMARHAGKIRSLLDGGATITDVAAELGVCWRTARRWMAELEDGAARSSIRTRFPPCAACGDPVDHDDDVWGGVENIHYTCALVEWRHGMRAPALPCIETGDAVKGETSAGKVISGVVVPVERLDLVVVP